MRNYPLVYLILGTVVALGIALLIVIIGLAPPASDIYLLMIYMSLSGIGTVVFVYLLYRRVLMNWVNSLRWSLMVMVVTTIILVFLNVYATAKLMFINYHDLILTTSLLVFGGLTAVVFGMFIANSIAHRIQVLADAIERLAHGHLDTRIPAGGNDEFSKLASLINWMGENLQKVEQEKQQIEQTRRDLIAWISHDLRTPLAAMQALLESITDGIVTEREEINGHIHSSLVEVNNLKVLIEDLFAIAQMDTGHMSLRFVNASLSDLISDTVSSMNARANACNIKIIGKIDPSIDPVFIAPDKVQRVLHNLIDNALHHTPPNGKILIAAYRQNGIVRVDVHNTGSVIPEGQIPYIFEKFYRGEEARDQPTSGTRRAGLGLAIARGFVEAHAGKIWVESHPEKGTRFSFVIPGLPSDQPATSL